jgi:hypothetical protein
VTPVVQCEWTDAPDGDPTKGVYDIYSTPMVADLNLDLDPGKLQPSIVVTTYASTPGGLVGMLRVFDGRTCAEQMRIGGPDDPERAENQAAYAASWAIGDLDGDVGKKPDGHPEIVGLRRVGDAAITDPIGLVAFGVDTSGPTPKLVRRWHGRVCGQNGAPDQPVTFAEGTYNFGPGLWDLDDDGVPEIVLDRMVFDASGCLLNAPAAVEDYLRLGLHSVVADVDLDGAPDLVRHDGVFGWDTQKRAWALKPWFAPSAGQAPGHVAVVDVGRYSSIPGHAAADPLPEVVVVSAASTKFDPESTGSIRVQTLTGEIVFGPLPLHHAKSPYGGHGGPPTASDFDGDGQVELAVAANEHYMVFDPDCAALPPAERPGGACARVDATLPEGLLWAQPSQDFSSSVTGSSVFDFDGDGASEVVYGDECYLRVYDGKTGAVRFSAPASSGTGYELPTVADVDGDFATEIVAVRASGPACPASDPLFPAAAPWEKKGGFLVLRDPQDRWVSSRPIWNQHAYSITHVTDDGRVPKSSQVARNWEVPGLNNFRQNTQGKLGKDALADLTVELEGLDAICAGQAGTFDVSARVCNRGTAPVQDGVKVVFEAVPKGEGGAAKVLCEATTPTLLDVGACVVVTCEATLSGDEDVAVVADPGHAIADCHPGNNVGAGSVGLCPQIE